MENSEDFSSIDHVIQLDNGKKIRVWETNPKENTSKRNNTVLIASGFARRMDHFAGLAEYLSSNGFHVIRYDSLHHIGLSTGNIDEFTMTIGKDSLLSVVNWMKTRGLNNLGLIAASLSARIVFEVAKEIDLSFLITAVGVVNLRDTLTKALGDDYSQFEHEDLPDDFDFEGHNLNLRVFFSDFHKYNWETLDKSKLKNFNIPFIAFNANNDNWVKKDDVIQAVSHINSDKCKLYTLIGSSHDLGENLVVLRHFYQSVTKAAVALDVGSIEIDVEINEPKFEALTTVTIQERRLKNKIESESSAQI